MHHGRSVTIPPFFSSKAPRLSAADRWIGPVLQEHLFDIESESQSTEVDHPYYIIYPDEFGGNWRVQAVPVAPDSFDSRKALPEVCVPQQSFDP